MATILSWLRYFRPSVVPPKEIICFWAIMSEREHIPYNPLSLCSFSRSSTLRTSSYSEAGLKYLKITLSLVSMMNAPPNTTINFGMISIKSSTTSPLQHSSTNKSSPPAQASSHKSKPSSNSTISTKPLKSRKYPKSSHS